MEKLYLQQHNEVDESPKEGRNGSQAPPTLAPNPTICGKDYNKEMMQLSLLNSYDSYK